MISRRHFAAAPALAMLGHPLAVLAQSDGARPAVGLMVLGHVDHGKTTLVAALDRLYANRTSYAEIDAAPQIRRRGLEIRASRVGVAAEARDYTFTDAPGHGDILKAMIAGVAAMDGAILVVSAADGPMPQTRAHVRLAAKIGIEHMVVYLNKVDRIDDAELLDLVEAEVRDLLSDEGFRGDDIQVVRGSALAALEGRDVDIGTGSIRALMAAVSETVPIPSQPVEGAFLMPVEDVFSISGRGTLATGRVERGVVEIGDEIEIVGFRPSRTTTCSGIEMFRKRLDRGEAGANVGLLLRGLARGDILPGQVLSAPGTVVAHTGFAAEIYLLNETEGGRRAPIFAGHRPKFFLRTAEVTGAVTLGDGTEMLRPGDTAAIAVELIVPIAIEAGLRFAIREAGRTVGIGVVSEIIA